MSDILYKKEYNVSLKMLKQKHSAESLKEVYGPGRKRPGTIAYHFNKRWRHKQKSRTIHETETNIAQTINFEPF